ncbi:MAG: hypothetical protein AAF492_17425, partial [Verrucomicrobiota bacterium]
GTSLRHGTASAATRQLRFVDQSRASVVLNKGRTLVIGADNDWNEHESVYLFLSAHVLDPEGKRKE